MNPGTSKSAALYSTTITMHTTLWFTSIIQWRMRISTPSKSIQSKLYWCSYDAIKYWKNEAVKKFRVQQGSARARPIRKFEKSRKSLLSLARRTSKLQFDLCSWISRTHIAIQHYDITWSSSYYAVNEAEFNASKMKQIRRWRIKILAVEDLRPLKIMIEGLPYS